MNASINDHEILSTLVKNPQLHARFVNTLSFMEYIGARKILKSQPADLYSADLLRHTAEEIRHAQLLKKLALRISDGGLNTYDTSQLLCGKEGEQYLQTIDYAVEADLGKNQPRLNYLYTTLLVEERAETFYPVYESFLAELGFGGVVSTILRDEKNHLQDIQHALRDEENGQHEKRLLSLRAVEQNAYAEFMKAVGNSFC